MIAIMLSLLFTGAIAIFALIAGSVAKVSKTLGCESQYQGVLNIWKGVDYYLQQVDQSFCTAACPCLINNTTGFTNNATVVGDYNTWNKNGSFTAFQNCSQSVIDSVNVKYNSNPDTNKFPINSTAFAQFWEKVEMRFNCTGFCNTTYINPSFPTRTATMYKYLFSNINR